MDQIQLYTKHKDIQKSDALFVVENYLRLVKWKKEGEVILDIGCGDGEVTNRILYPHIPASAKIVGTDLSEKMISIARKQQRNEKIDFRVLDIVSDLEMTEIRKYNHLFSFYCLHWVQDQRTAFKNMYDLLVPGGDMLLTFLSKHLVFDGYEAMMNTKWSKYMADVKKYIGPYHHCKNPVETVEDLLLETGFISHVCRTERRSFTFSGLQEVKKAFTAVSPFMSRIPPEEHNNYTNDYLEAVRKLKNVKFEKFYRKQNNNTEVDEKVTIFYDLIVVFASKPLEQKNRKG